MAIPDLDDIRRPALKLLAERATLTQIRDVFDLLAPEFQLNDEDLNILLPSGTQTTWHNRVGWACYDLYRAGALDRPKKGYYQINPFGQQVLTGGPDKLTRHYLCEVSPEFSAFMRKSKSHRVGHTKKPGDTTKLHNDATPEEAIDEATESLHASLQADLLEQLRGVDPFRFEQLVLDLLVAMGYGGSREEAAKLTRASNDEGIDGVINEDRLGLDVIYVQAKRWKNSVGRVEIQNFVGALAGKQANKGIFISTGSFNKNAIEYANKVSQKIILIDGDRLADLMIEHNVGVYVTRSVEIKKIDSDYFDET